MGKRLFITEKPSVAQDFARALKVNGTRKDGYIEDNDTIITWCVGHLITMSYPEKYDEELKQWKLETLPFLPKNFKYEVIESVKKQYGVVHTLLQRDDLDEIYYSGDAAREGEYIQRLVRQFAKIKPGVIERRVWVDSQTDDEILRGIKEAKLLNEYDLLSDSAYMRAIEDYLFGINLSRAYTVKYGNLVNNIIEPGTYKPISVGRVMTCVLGMIVDRERLIRGSKEIPFFGIKGLLENEIPTEWKTVEESAYYESPLLYKSGAFKNKIDAESFVERCNNIGKMTLQGKIISKETKSAPLLYNLAELQGECSAALKISPDETLEIVQSLYEKKMVTYPRTDARVLTSAIAKEIHNNISGLQKHPILGNKATDALYSDRKNQIENLKYTNDKQVSDHYAIIPTGQFVDLYNGLNVNEKAVYDMISMRFLAIFYPDAIYEKISCQFICGQELFVVSDKSLAEPGFLSLYGKDREEMCHELVALEEGKEYNASFMVQEGKTSPPKRYTSGNMVLAMENAGQLIEDAELRAQIKSSGIGTSATRGDTIKKLIAIGYIDLNKKTQVLTPSERGEIVFDIIKEITPSLLKPEMTANWEKGLDMVKEGNVSKDDFLAKLYAYVTREVTAVKNSDVAAIKEKLPPEKQSSGSGQYQKKNVPPKFKSKHPDTMPDTCPHCNGKFIDYDWGTVCKGCCVKIPKTVSGITLAEEHRAALLYAGKTEKITGFKKKDGSGTFDAKLEMDKEWKMKFVFK